MNEATKIVLEKVAIQAAVGALVGPITDAIVSRVFKVTTRKKTVVRIKNLEKKKGMTVGEFKEYLRKKGES